MQRTLALLLPLISASTASAAAPAAIEPVAPRQGTTITVRYDPAHDKAQLTAADAVHAVAWITRDDGTESSITVRWPTPRSCTRSSA